MLIYCGGWKNRVTSISQDFPDSLEIEGRSFFKLLKLVTSVLCWYQTYSYGFHLRFSILIGVYNKYCHMHDNISPSSAFVASQIEDGLPGSSIDKHTRIRINIIG